MTSSSAGLDVAQWVMCTQRVRHLLVVDDADNHIGLGREGDVPRHLAGPVQSTTDQIERELAQ